MTGVALRDRLHSLWVSLTDPRMEQRVDSDNIIPSRFLSDNNISLILDSFTPKATEADSLNKQPPVLFRLRPCEIIMNHPINPWDSFFTDKMQVDTSPAIRVQRIFDRESMPLYRGRSLARYLDKWAMGGYPRHLPPAVPDLPTLCGIDSVSDPHPLNTETRGWLKPGRWTDIQWENYIYEYTETRPDGSILHPHLILLGVQSCNGIDNTISLGELTTIVTAMRCRAYQPAVFNEDAILVGDEQQSVNGNPSPGSEDELAFKGEKRFPVIMASLVGPQHVRIIYACMNGLELCIRASACHKIIPETEIMVHNIGSVLLSMPLQEAS
ncbi:hypothetical protein ASPVEDRAFT_147312 [Aspergillus versicolor CBS 583.65]|uniref:Uncharacterized protein n=1 Tax=Aspergillus versicolor CBS 583.65 TaxID=1036611 RepID=A0A1L9P970_ASPVE|nr:uncharacterized protein ASPVEDRAFT_147312 [Aspergillus versicolor CBS 583.65]OJI98032.1 hypothetical protein ASPVEDRAFT_147312 [Aspergillus versicolor CBS 583.65]